LKTRLLSIDPAEVGPETLGEIEAVLAGGGVMAFPTETFYGLGAAAFSSRAVARIFELKGRDRGKPLPLIAADLDMVREMAAGLPDAFRPLAAEFWPGPLTLVLRAAAGLPAFILGPGATVAVRVPPLPWVRRLSYDLSQPLTATSANLSGEKEIAAAADVVAAFDGKVELIVDGGKTPGGAPSTVLDLTAPEPRLLRPGAVPEAKIRAVLGAWPSSPGPT
jgi:L-threonylcarbamoyladenylate synthase